MLHFFLWVSFTLSTPLLMVLLLDSSQLYHLSMSFISRYSNLAIYSPFHSFIPSKIMVRNYFRDWVIKVNKKTCFPWVLVKETDKWTDGNNEVVTRGVLAFFCFERIWGRFLTYFGECNRERFLKKTKLVSILEGWVGIGQVDGEDEKDRMY